MMNQSVMSGDRGNRRLNEEIEKFIDQWDGTVTGQCAKNMYENGDSYEHICEFIGVDMEDYEED